MLPATAKGGKQMKKMRKKESPATRRKMTKLIDDYSRLGFRCGSANPAATNLDVLSRPQITLPTYNLTASSLHWN